MFLLAFLVGVAFWPGALDPATTLRWALMAVGAAFLLLFHEPPRLRAAGACLCLILLTLVWTPDWLYGAEDAAHLLTLAAVFALGASRDDLLPAWKGLGAGVGLSGLMALFQFFGSSPVQQIVAPAGLFMNRNFLAEAGLVVLTVAILYRQRWLIPGALLATVVPMQRATLLAAAVVVLVLWLKGLKASALVLAIGVTTCALCMMGLTLLMGTPEVKAAPQQLVDIVSSHDRLIYWRDAVHGLTLFGHGLGSYAANFPDIHFPHSEPLQALYELGLFAIAPLGLLIYLFREPFRAEHAVLAGLCAIALFGFPFHMPVTGFAAALAAGHLARRRALVRLPEPARRVAPARGHVGQAYGQGRVHPAGGLQPRGVASVMGDTPVQPGNAPGGR